MIGTVYLREKIVTILGFEPGHIIDEAPGSSVGRAFDCQSNDPCRDVVRSPVRADIFSCLSEVKAARKAMATYLTLPLCLKNRDSTS